MKRLSIIVATLGLILASAPAALARADAYYTVVCDGGTSQSDDAPADDQGGKDDAVAQFGEKHGMSCSLDGPFQD
jgi:hypothetical protein